MHLVGRRDTGREDRVLARILAALRSPPPAAARASAEAAALTRLAASVLRGRGDPPALLEEMRRKFGLAALSLLEWRENGAGGARLAGRPPGARQTRVPRWTV